ncbi:MULTISPECIES: alpha/beta fold hydrolase [Gaetbulibacter]|uniref:alpha/beta fold hydrolase n=1 Tax=Gaetbulibacter TaxID=311207 RepID=UPI0021CE75F2|nr:alpha/beta hydrolase [Gaetbulibacter sp. NE]
MNFKTNILIIISVFIYKMNAQNIQNVHQKIDTSYFVKIGDIDQYISLKGIKNKPIVLYLHGGPGAASSAHSEKITASLEQDFLVIHWDQRGAGKTLKQNNIKQRPTLALMQSDAEELLNYILNTFHRQQIILVANSWGTSLAFHLSETHPDKISTLVAISPIVNLLSSQKSLNKMLIRHFRKSKNQKAVTQLKTINIPYHNAKDMAIQFKWLSEYQGESINDTLYSQYLQFFEQWYTKWSLLYSQLYKINKLKNKPLIQGRTIIFYGDKDYTAYYKLTKKFFKGIKSKEKEIYRFKDVGHQIPMEASKSMQELLLKVLLKGNYN